MVRFDGRVDLNDIATAQSCVLLSLVPVCSQFDDENMTCTVHRITRITFKYNLKSCKMFNDLIFKKRTHPGVENMFARLLYHEGEARPCV